MSSMPVLNNVVYCVISMLLNRPLVPNDTFYVFW